VTWRERERRRPTRRQQVRDWLVLALTVAGSAIALGQLPRGHPVVPALSLWGGKHQQAAPPQAISSGFGIDRTTRLRGPSTASYGSTYMLTGRTGTVNRARVTGTVVLRGSLDRSRWTALSKTSTDREGRFAMTISLRHRGSLRLRLLTPDGFVAIGTLRVT
jgi:hypothetical protein